MAVVVGAVREGVRVTTIADVRSNLATIAASITGWSGSLYVSDKTTHGVIVVSRPAFDPRMVLGQSKASHLFTMTAHANRANPEAAEQLLDTLAELSGDTSLLAAVQTSANWTVDVDYAQVVSIGENRPLVYGTEPNIREYIGCSYEIEVVW
jgi:hypothetical protein